MHYPDKLLKLTTKLNNNLNNIIKHPENLVSSIANGIIPYIFLLFTQEGLSVYQLNGAWYLNIAAESQQHKVFLQTGHL